MRTLIILLSLFGAVSTARADWASSQIDGKALPAPCSWILPVPAGAPMRVQLAAVTSAANCTAMVKLNAVPVTPTVESARALEHAAAPSIAMLDNVIAAGDLEATIIAQQAKGDLFDGISIRLSQSIGRGGALTGAEAQAFRENADAAFALGQPARDLATASFSEVTRLAATPEGMRLAANPVVAYAVESARNATTTRVSRR